MARRIAICVLVACCAVAGIVHGASNVVQYRYDATGNIIAIDRINAAPITIGALSPSSGPVGTAVAIAGTGFSPTLAANVVAFNGAAATVVAASATSITAVVPTDAATGRVTVRVGGNTATSPQDFVVATTNAPTIVAFTPVSGTAGSAVMVSGSNFDPVAGATTVGLNQNSATTSSVTATSVALVVPAGTGSGKIRVTTPAGSAVSAADFIVPPGGVAAADILSTTRLVSDGAAQTISVYTTNKYGLALFEGAAGAWMSLHVANFNVNPAGALVPYTIYKPDNTQLASGMLYGSNLSIHLPVLPTTGTYSILLRTGLAQIALDAKLETNAFVPGDGATLAVTQGVGQSTRALIAAVSGEQKAMMIAGLASEPAGGGLSYAIARSNGSAVRNGNVAGLGLTMALASFVATETYTVLLTSTGASTRSTFKVAVLGGGAISVDGAPVDVAIANPGEGARLTFAGFAGENLGLGITGVALAPATTTNVSVYRPDASFVAAGTCVADGTQCSANLENLPVSGTYTIIVQPSLGATGMQRVWLSHDVVGTLESGTPLGVVLSRPGQNARLSFAGSTGAVPALQLRAVTTSPPAQGLFVKVSQPDRSVLGSAHLTGLGQMVVTPLLQASGTYTLFIEPESAAKGAATATMEALLDPGQALTVDAPTQDTAIGIAGGSARLVFAGTAGQNLGLGVSGFALSPPSDASISIYKPDGVLLVASGCTVSTGSCAVTLLNLPATGTYSAVVRPTTGATGRFGVTLSSEWLSTLVVGGSVMVNLDRPGRNARIAFAGSAGQTLRLSWSGVAITGAPGNAVISVIGPDGSTMGAALVANGTTSTYDIPALPTTGAYALFVDPASGATLNATLRIIAR